MNADTLKSKITTIINLYNVRNFEEVIQVSNRLVKKNPHNDMLWNILGLAHQQLKEYHKAEISFLRGLQENPKNISAINNIGNNYKYLNNYHKAEEYYKRALGYNPNYPNTLVNYGNLKFTFNKFEEALKLLNKSLNVNKKLVSAHYNISLIYQSIGSFEKSLHHLKQINNINPEFTKADKTISGLIDYQNDEDHLDKMKDKLVNLNLNFDQKINLYFGISKAHEDKKEFKQAFEYLENGNNLKRTQSNYNINEDTKLFANIKKLFNNYQFQPSGQISNKQSPIFVVGMPRSGTTLVEQIISSHPDVSGLGETDFLNSLINKIFFNKEDDKYEDVLNSANQNKLNAISTEYFDIISHFGTKEKYFTDKSLLNFQWIGLIKIIFPNAKVINCIRDPKDNCLSIYKNLFDHEGAWCYDKNELTQYYKLYSDLMAFWRDKIPNFVYDIKYENLIKDPINQIKLLIKTSNLKWDEKCLNFDKNKSVIKTLSVNQARKKIYSSSVKSYDNYKEYNKNLFTDLD